MLRFFQSFQIHQQLNARWSSSAPSYLQLREQKQEEIGLLAEVQSHHEFLAALEDPAQQQALFPSTALSPLSLAESGLSAEQAREVVAVGMATQLLHREARVASFLGRGFYTIGPCGEELLGAVGLHLQPTDPMALHYRHIATQLVRQFRHQSDLNMKNNNDINHINQNNNNNKNEDDDLLSLQSFQILESLLLDRARAYTCSSLDPVSQGMHCLIGGGEFDYPITSTLASQAPPALGRALGGQLAHALSRMAFPGASSLRPAWPASFLSYVSLGDGSANNAHFLAAENLAEYARFRGFKCPLVLAVSDNDLCISLRGHGWLQRGLLPRLRIPVTVVDGSDLYSVAAGSATALAAARADRGPAALVFANLPRRFGHAATDRQDAYLAQSEVAAQRARHPLLAACATLARDGVCSRGALRAAYLRLDAAVTRAFAAASAEPRNDAALDREALVRRCYAPLPERVGAARAEEAGGRAYVMRQFMTSVLDETLAEEPRMVYIGEDVEHGGYYLVTAGLAAKHPQRVRDFPPDETTLVGAAMGMAQAGLVPVVEIPYAKYLDCGADMFFEAALMRWLANGAHPTGMVVRLQGFDRGVFGGNFHTHNSLHLPPGVDVFCFSNGPDYARGFRTAFAMARHGRVVMLVDSTQLLNLRNLHEGADGAWSFTRAAASEPYEPDDVAVYWPRVDKGKRNALPESLDPQAVAVVTYGNGVVTALQARRMLAELDPQLSDRIVVIDSPRISSVPGQLKACLARFQNVLFADVCKQGQNPFGNFVTTLRAENALPPNWLSVAATPTYNPLGSTITFLNSEDIIGGLQKLKNGLQ